MKVVNAEIVSLKAWREGAERGRVLGGRPIWAPGTAVGGSPLF
jgi:hypothetical protein